MSREDMRAGDSDREQAATRLREALDQGRLDLHEYDDRLQRTYAAKTYGELDALTADLPGVIPAAASQVAPRPPASDPVPQAAGPDQERRKGPGGGSIGGYAGVVVVCMLIWLMTSLSSGHWQYFWPGWMLIPLVLGLFARFKR